MDVAGMLVRVLEPLDMAISISYNGPFGMDVNGILIRVQMLRCMGA